MLMTSQQWSVGRRMSFPDLKKTRSLPSRLAAPFSYLHRHAESASLTSRKVLLLQEGRRLWGALVKRCRDGIRLVVAYVPQGDVQRLVAYIQAFPWALKACAF